MDRRERKEQRPSLPPDYVSLAQLQERWLQKQREKEMREKGEEEMREKREEEAEKQQRDAGLNADQKQRGLLRNDWRKEKASIEDGGKGKEITIGGFENKKNDKKKRDKRHGSSKKKYEKGIEVEKEKLESETNKEFNGGIKGGLSGENSGNGGLQGSTEEIVDRIDFRGGFSRNGDNRGSGYNSKRENNGRVRFNQLKETEVNLGSEKKEYSRNWRERRGNGSDRDRYREDYYRLKTNGHVVSKGDVVEPELKKKAEDENVEVRSEIGDLNGRDRNKSSDDHRVEREGLNDNVLAQDKKVDEEMVLAVESVRIGEKGGVGNRYRRYGNQRGDNGRRFGGGDWKANVGDRRRYGRPGRFEGRWNTKEWEKSGNMMWVKKGDKSGADDDDDDARVGSSGISADQE